jgi:hypothetical protein
LILGLSGFRVVKVERDATAVDGRIPIWIERRGLRLELRLSALLESSPLPPEPHINRVECFVMDTYAATGPHRRCDDARLREPNLLI